MSGRQRDSHDSSLLAVDAGIRAGFALYGGDGRLRWFRSRNYGSMARLKRAAYALVGEIDGLAHLVVEGGGVPSEPWLKEAARRGIPARQVHAMTWREPLLLSRNRRSGAAAKERADVLARRVIDWSGLPGATSLRHDAAEAILLGLWALVEIGWLEALPDDVAHG